MSDDKFEINEFCNRLQNEGLEYNVFGFVFGEGLTEIVISAENSFETVKEQLSPLEETDRIEINFDEPEIEIKGEMKPYEPNP